MAAQDVADECSVDGDADILGIGVRLGIYFQLSANIIIAFVRPEEGVIAIPVTNVLMTGIFAALLHSMSQNSITPNELVCSLWVIVLDLPFVLPVLTATQGQRFSYWAVTVVVLRWTAFVGLNAWFWFSPTGVTNYAPGCPPPRVFFFANLSAIGNIRTLFKVTACLGIFYSASILLVLVVKIVRLSLSSNSDNAAPQSYEEKWEVRLRGFQFDDDEESYFQSSLSMWKDPPYLAVACVSCYSWGLYGVFMCFLMMFSVGMICGMKEEKVVWLYAATIPICIVLVALSVMPVELQLYWNNIGGINTITTSGQLMAFTIGSFSLLRAIWLSVMDSKHGKSEEREGGIDVETQTETLNQLGRTLTV